MAASHPALLQLEHYVLSGVITPEIAEQYKERFNELQLYVGESQRREQDINNRLNDIKRNIRDDTIILEAARIRKAELLEASDAADNDRRQAALELSEIEAQLSNIQTEINEATLRENELNEDVLQLQRENNATVVPALQTLMNSITETKEETSLATSAIQVAEENKAELRRRVERLNKDIKTLHQTLEYSRTEEGKAGIEPARLTKQIENVDRGLTTVNAELDRIRSALATRNSDIATQKATVTEVDEVRATLERKLHRHREDIDLRDQEVISLERTLRNERNNHKELLERRVEVRGNEERALSSMRAAQGEVESAKQVYERAKRELKQKLEVLSNAIAAEPPVKAELVEKELEKKRIHEEMKRVENTIVGIKREMDSLVAQYLKEETVEKKHRNALAEVTETCTALETERDQWHNEESLAYKQLSAIKLQREIKAREVEKTIAAKKSMIETSRMKELELADLAKQLVEVQNRLKHYASLYDVVKSEKNSYAVAIQQSHQAASEMRERLKILKNEVDILRNECSAKDKALTKELHTLATTASQRDVLRATVNTATKEYTEKQLRVQQQILYIDKLSSIIDGLERDMSKLTKQYDTAVELRNFTGVQLMERNDELVVLYEKSNVHEKSLHNGEKALNDMGEEIRGLTFALQDLDRQLHIVRIKLPETPIWAERILELQNALVAARQVTQKLCSQLETPGNSSRWVALTGDDPDIEQLQLRINHLDERLNLNRQELFERELVLEELKGLNDKLMIELHGNQAQTETQNTAAAALAKQSNDLQSKIRESTRKLMALVSEMSMYQATAIKYATEIQAAEVAVMNGQKQLEAGLPPSLAAEQRLSLAERTLTHTSSTSNALLLDGPRSTADLRPNAYTPSDGSGLPKPYYNPFAPFKPSEPGASMRHFRAPETKPLEI